MKTIISITILLTVAFTSFAQVSGKKDSQIFVIDDVTVIDGTGKPAQSHMRVTVKNGQIESVENIEQVSKISKEARRIDGKGKFLIPGLWDTHIHLVDVGEEAIPILPVYGITSVRDMGGDVQKLKAWRSQIESGALLGPRIKLCGPMLEGKWDIVAGGRTDHWAVSDPEQARKIVNQLADEGVDCIKMRGYASPETYFALVAAAKERNLPFGGHAPWGVDPIESSNAGQVSYEHAFYPYPWDNLAPEKKLEIENTFRKNGSLIVPTLIAWETFRFSEETIGAVVNDYEAKSDPRLKFVSPSLRRNWLSGLKDLKTQTPGTPGWNKAIDQVYEQIAEMHDHGVGIMAGTDTGATMVFPGSALHQELKLLVKKCRFTPMDALLSATIIPAKFFKMEDRLGTIEKGKMADLVLLSADPLQDISNIEKIDGVMVNGNWLNRAMLDKIVADVQKKIAANKSVVK